MSKNELSGEQYLGCLAVLWNLLVTMPISLALMFGVLITLGSAVPTWVWVVYWIYVPSVVLGMVINGVLRVLLVDKQ